jgi:hypothetical protein
MPLTVTVTRGYTFQQDQLLDYSLLNLLGTPTITVTGALADLSNITLTSVQTGQALVWDSGTSKWINGSVAAAYLGVMTGATSGDDGAKGAVPAPSAGDQAKYLAGDGTWQTLPTAPSATASNLYLHQFYI